MQVFVVSPNYDREGYGEPEAVFSTREAAEAWMRVRRGQRWYELFELTLDDSSD